MPENGLATDRTLSLIRKRPLYDQWAKLLGVEARKPSFIDADAKLVRARIGGATATIRDHSPLGVRVEFHPMAAILAGCTHSLVVDWFGV
jgi:hypothetical protein